MQVIIGLPSEDNPVPWAVPSESSGALPVRQNTFAHSNQAKADTMDWNDVAATVLTAERLDSRRFSFQDDASIQLARLLEQIRRDHAALLHQINQALKDNQLNDLDKVIDQPPTNKKSIRLITRLVLGCLGPPLKTDADQVKLLRDSLENLLKHIEQQDDDSRESPDQAQKSDRNSSRDRSRDTVSIRSDSKPESSRRKVTFRTAVDGTNSAVQKSFNTETSRQQEQELRAAQTGGDRDVKRPQDTAEDRGIQTPNL